jgi:hypothetical protein
MQTPPELPISDGPLPPPASGTITVGPDRVTVTDREVIIDATHEMPDWEVRDFTRAPIYFREKKYFLRRTEAGQRPYAVRYVLDPWPEAYSQTIRSFYTYDEEAVAQREATVKSGRVDDIGRAALIMFYPFLGMLWSGTKEKLIRFGFVPRSITGISIFVSFGLFLLQGVFAKVQIMTSLRTGKIVLGGMIRAFYGQDTLNLWLFDFPILWLDVALLVMLLLDVLIRYSQHLRGDEESPWGFGEWLICLVPGQKSQEKRTS